MPRGDYMKKEFDINGNRLGVIYEIYNKANGKRYIGQSICYKDRWANHKVALNKGKCDNYLLQEDWNKYGSDCFEFNVIKKGIKQCDLLQEETNYMNKFGGINSDSIYNMEDINGFNDIHKKRHVSNTPRGKRNHFYDVHRYGAQNPNYKNYKYSSEFVNQLRKEFDLLKSKKEVAKLHPEIAYSTLCNLINHGVPSSKSNYKYQV